MGVKKYPEELKEQFVSCKKRGESTLRTVLLLLALCDAARIVRCAPIRRSLAAFEIATKAGRDVEVPAVGTHRETFQARLQALVIGHVQLRGV